MNNHDLQRMQHTAHMEHAALHSVEGYKPSFTKDCARLGCWTGIGIAVATGATGGLFPLIAFGGMAVGAAIGEAISEATKE